MRANASYMDYLDFEFHHSDEPVIIPFYVEYKVLITHGTDTVEILFNIRKTIPLGIAGSFVPLFECCLRIGARKQGLQPQGSPDLFPEIPWLFQDVRTAFPTVFVPVMPYRRRGYCRVYRPPCRCPESPSYTPSGRQDSSRRYRPSYGIVSVKFRCR